MMRMTRRMWRQSGTGSRQICIDDLFTEDMRENLTVFVSVLHLVRDGRLDVWQEVLPYGDIFIEIRTDWTSGTIEDSDGRPIPEAVI